MTRVLALTVALLALVAAPVIAPASAEAAGISPHTRTVKGTQRPPACAHHRCPGKVTPSPGPFVVVPARPRIPRTER